MSEKMTGRDLALIGECARYCISDDGRSYYRLGGYGHAPIRYHHASLRKLKRAGLVENSKGYYAATDKGREYLARALSEGDA